MVVARRATVPADDQAEHAHACDREQAETYTAGDSFQGAPDAGFIARRIASPERAPLIAAGEAETGLQNLQARPQLS
jgi:hypothetical protein